jgi:hypothetical protein
MNGVALSAQWIPTVVNPDFLDEAEWTPFQTHLLTYLVTELSPSLGAINWAGTQELPSISWIPKVHYRIHKSPPLVPILSPIKPIYTIPAYLSKIHFEYISILA